MLGGTKVLRNWLLPRGGNRQTHQAAQSCGDIGTGLFLWSLSVYLVLF